MELVLVNIILAVTTSFIAIYIVLTRKNRRSRLISLIILGSSIWSYGYALELYYTDLNTKLFWSQIQVIGMILTNLWPLFTFHYMGNNKWSGKQGAVIFSIAPLFFLGLLLTNNYHGLILRSVSLNHIDSHLPLIKTYGECFTFFILYTYMIIIGSCIYTIYSLRKQTLNNTRYLSFIIGIISLPVLSSFYYHFFSKNMYIDYTSMIFGFLSIGIVLFTPSDFRIGNILPLEYANILGKMEDIVILTDENRRITHVNPSAKVAINKELSISEDTIVGRYLDDLIEKVEIIGKSDDPTEVVAGGRNYDLSIFTVPDWRGKPSTTCYILREVTDRVKLENKLRLLHLYASDISKTKSYDDISTITAKVLKNSLGFCNGVLILDGESETHKKFWGPIECIEETDYVLNELIKLDKSYYPHFEIFLRNIGYGGDCVFSDNAMFCIPIMENHVQLGVICIFRESEKKFSENEQMLLEIFGNHIAAAIHRIQDDKALKDTQKAEIDKIMEGAGRVANMVRHDLRGPLQTIRNVSYLIEKNPSTIDKMAPMIENSIDYMTNIIEDLVYTENPSSLDKHYLNLNTLIKQTLNQQIIPKKILVEKDLYPEPLMGNFDKIKIQRMLNNLFRNAIDAMPDGGRLTISTDKKSSKVFVSIRDTGVGVEDVDKLFVPFHTTKTNGMGLGLISVKQTIEAHKGSIEVNSEPGKGTNFLISIPINEDYRGNNTTKLSSITKT
ncbi:GHKL domain-containing protein [Candidatus Bathyarchaeota archaeon]|nr:GHKL domain-containing protein [Candidatus Bathyarchaeota archaeon]